VEELVQLGQLAPEEAEHHPNANIITRAIGAAETIEFDVGIYDLQDQDRFLLCSDGLYREVSEQDIIKHMRRGECEQIVEVLLQLALDRGAKDNVSIVAVEFARQP
jgi:protein phosphatase